MKTTVAIEIDTDHLSGYTETYLAQLWHIGQANPAEHGDSNASHLTEHVGREIIRRWLASTPPDLWNHQGRYAAIRAAHSPTPDEEAGFSTT